MKQITFAILCMALITAVQAQDFNFGVTAGPNLSTAKMKGEGAEQPKYVASFHIGVFAELELTNKISLRPELKYQALGYKYTADENGPGFREKTTYITLPVLAEYGITEKLKAGLGPYLSAKLKAQWKWLPSPETEEVYDEEFFDYTDADNEEFKNLDYGISTGVSYQVLPKLGANLRYSHGLSNIFKTEATDGSKAYNRFFSLGVSYTIPLNKGKK
ncbi:porin family protein [Niabella aquatica]